MQRVILIKDSIDATRVAGAIWQNVYGDKILDEQPFKAVKKNDSIWSVTSTFKDKNSYGGNAYIEMNKYTCEVIKILKGK